MSSRSTPRDEPSAQPAFVPVSDLVKVADLVKVEEEERSLDFFAERFGIKRSVFADFLIFRPNKRCLSLVPHTLRLPTGTDPTTLGLPFFYLDPKHPRPTLAAVQRFGRWATKHVVSLTAFQLQEFVQGNEIFLESEESMVWTTGWVIVRYRNIALGLGDFRAKKRSFRGVIPKSWREWRGHLRSETHSLDSHKDVDRPDSHGD